MNFVAKVIVTDVKSGEKRDYANIVDLETGGIASISTQKGGFDELKKLIPIELIAVGKLGRYGLEVIKFQQKGGE